MNTYHIQLKLHTLANCVVIEDGEQGKTYDRFELENIKFKHWDFNFTNGHKSGAWLVDGEVDAITAREASKYFMEKMNNIIPKIAFLSQCYTEYFNEPYLIHKLNGDIAYFQYSKASGAVPLHFNDKSLDALKALIKESNISNEFFYYWNDMINSIGYSAKLLIACSALEALGKGRDKQTFRKELLGEELANKVFAPQTGVRHRLTHGEYFSDDTDSENYLQQIYIRIIQYFNQEIIEQDSIHENVKNPQRHPWGNKAIGRYFIKRKNNDTNFDLGEILQIWDEKGIDNLSDDFEFLSGSEVGENY